ncbi:MAG: M48 family metallopeptidase [Treponema sp.]|jgi:predicted Zn-dependent protease|nr:M48 family metallopeptidase [Treponema sp.]
MKRIMRGLFTILGAVLLAAGFAAACVTNPYTGRTTMALVNGDELLAMSFSEYKTFLNGHAVIKGTADAALVERVGGRIRQAAEKWAASMGQSDHLKKYQWEYNLVQSGEVNAWCMPGGKIVVYTGILPVTRDETGLAVVLGHEVAHALLDHGQQRMSADMLQQFGAEAVNTALAKRDQSTRQLAVTAFGVSTTLFGTLPFSRSHESEADHIGLILMAIAGYNPDQAPVFWERMSSAGGGTPEFLSTHPSDATRIRQLRGWIPEARQKAAQTGTVP